MIFVFYFEDIQACDPGADLLLSESGNWLTWRQVSQYVPGGGGRIVGILSHGEWLLDDWGEDPNEQWPLPNGVKEWVVSAIRSARNGSYSHSDLVWSMETPEDWGKLQQNLRRLGFRVQDFRVSTRKLEDVWAEIRPQIVERLYEAQTVKPAA